MRPRKAAVGITTRHYVAEGFKEDLYNILREFNEGGHYTFPDFTKLWREKQMATVYMGRTSKRELCEFTHECFATVFTILRYPESPLPIMAGAVYCLYCLYQCQPIGKFRIHITLDDNKLIWELLQTARKEKLYAVAFAIIALRYESAFQIVGNIILMEPGLQAIRSITLEENKLPLLLNRRWNRSIQDLYKSESMQEYIAVNKEYTELKKSIGFQNPNGSNDDTGLISLLEKIAIGDLKTCLDLLKKKSDDDDDDSEASIGLRRRRLKRRQLAAPVETIASSTTEGESLTGNEEDDDITTID